MKNALRGLVFIAVVVLVSSGTALADEVRLKNGDRISGRIIRMEQNKLVLKTDYAGEITIDWPQVASISAEEQINQSLEILESVGDEYGQALSQLSLAELYFTQGESMAARAALEESIPAFERLEAALDLSVARELWEDIV